MKLIIAGLLLSLLSVIFAEETRLIELEPDQAAQIINQKDQSLKYAPKIESNVPGVRFIGDHPEHVVEDIYLANQYHGQDGLGAYLYGYSIPDIAKTEKKERSGYLQGAYNYIAGDGQEIKVQYWDDGTGFHQIDNVPKIQPKQVEDNPDVKAAKEEHLRLWHEQAERNSHPIADPNANFQNQYQEQGSYQRQPQPYASQNQGVTHYQAQTAGAAGQYAGVNSAHAQGHPGGLYQQGHAQQNTQINPNSVEYSGEYSYNQQAWAKGPGAAPGVGSGAAAGHSAFASHPAGVNAHHDASGGAGSGIGADINGGVGHASGAVGYAGGAGAGSAGGTGSSGGYNSAYGGHAAGGSGAGHAGSAGVGSGAGYAGGTGSSGGYNSQYAGHAAGGSGAGPAGSAGVGSGAVHAGGTGYTGGYNAAYPGHPAGGSGAGHAGSAGVEAGYHGHSAVGSGAEHAGSAPVGFGGGHHASTGSNAGSAGSDSDNTAQQAWVESNQSQQTEEEENGPPKGFFYAFDYPVGIIVGREGKNLEAYYSQSKNLYEKQLTGEAPRPSSASSSYHASA